MTTRGVVGLNPGDVVYVRGDPHEFVKVGHATEGVAQCNRRNPVTLRRIKPDGTYTMSQCFDASECLQEAPQ